MELKPVPASKVLDLYYLDNRCSLLELAAFLDRLDRGDSQQIQNDPRWQRIRQALDLLASPSETPNRAERLLNLFS